MNITTAEDSTSRSSASSTQRGAVMAETTLLMALIALVAATVMTSFGGTIKDVFVDLGEALDPPTAGNLD